MTRESDRIVWVAAIGVAVSVGFLWLAFRNLEAAALAAAFRSAELWPWVPLAMIFYLIGQVVRGVRLRRLITQDADLPLVTSTNIVVLGYAVNNILPARMGEIARAGLLSDRTGIPFVQSLTVTLLERILDGWTMVFLFLVGTLLAQNVGAPMAKTAWLATGIFAVASAGIALMLLFPHGIASLASGLAGRVHPGFQDRVWRLCMHVSNGLAYLRRPAHALRLGALSLAVWVLESGMFLMMLPAFGLPMDFAWAVLAMAVTNLGILVPSTPGYVGPFHYFCTQTLVLLGVAGATATSYAISVHAVFYIPITLWGVGVMTRYGIELGWMTSMAGRTKLPTAPTTEIQGVDLQVLSTSRIDLPDDHPGQLVYAITEALLPAEGSRRTPPPAPVTHRVARFVQGQINALPTLLGMAFFVGLLGFRVLVRLRHVRSFCSLPLETRRRIVEFWAYGPYALARAIFRVPRSTALLSYFEEVSRPQLVGVEVGVRLGESL